MIWFLGQCLHIKQVKKEEADVETKKKQIKKREGLAKERDEKRDRRPSPHSLCVCCVSVQSLKSGAWVCAVDGSWQVTGTFQLGKPHSEEVLNESMQAMSHFVVPPTADAEEMLVFEPIPDNKSVHERVQKDVAAMKEKQEALQQEVMAMGQAMYQGAGAGGAGHPVGGQYLHRQIGRRTH